jgi:hypothetical protein
VGKVQGKQPVTFGKPVTTPGASKSARKKLNQPEKWKVLDAGRWKLLDAD